MPEEAKPVVERNYRVGDVGAGARVAQGENISWSEGLVSLPDGPALKQQFTALLDRIVQDPIFDEDARELAKAKTEAVAVGLTEVRESAVTLRRALLDAKSWFNATGSWVGHAIGDILKSEAAQKTIGTVTETSTKAVIASFLG